MDKDPSKARCGSGKFNISDHDLYWNGTTDAQLEALLKAKLGREPLSIEKTELKLMRTRINNLVNRTRRNMIEDMGLPGTPNRASHSKVKTAAQVRAQIESDEAAVVASTEAASKKQRTEDNGKDVQDEEDDEEALFTEESALSAATAAASASSSSSSSSSSSTVKPPPSKRFVNIVVGHFPALVDGAYLELVNGMLQLVVVDFDDEEENA